jgi:hypothetical protein
MIIKKKETVEFSDNELRCVEMTIMLMETLADNATHPDLVRLAGCAAEDLCAIYTKFLEGVD